VGLASVVHLQRQEHQSGAAWHLSPAIPMVLMCPWCNVTSRAETVHLCAILSKSPQPHAAPEKSLRQTKLEVHSTTYLASALQDCQGHEIQGKHEKVSQTVNWAGATTKSNVVPWMLHQKGTVMGKLVILNQPAA
jgi:hypothetical protein